MPWTRASSTTQRSCATSSGSARSSPGRSATSATTTARSCSSTPRSSRATSTKASATSSSKAPSTTCASAGSSTAWSARSCSPTCAAIRRASPRSQTGSPRTYVSLQTSGDNDSGGLETDQDRRDRLEQALSEIRRVIAGQDAVLERVLVCLLAQGHLLIEGVPGLAKTLTIKTTAAVLGGSFARIQFTPDLVPADLVGTRVYRPDSGTFDTELGPVFCNFLLADEINRAPAKVQSALLEVMQERQVTIAPTSHPVPDPFLVLATQNPIESEGTYPLPEAQVDRFMLKILIDYPEHDEELTVVQRQLSAAPELRAMLTLDELRSLQRSVFDVYVDPALVSYAVAVAARTREPSE